MTSKSTFEGPIGQMLAEPVHELPLVEFQPLTSIELPLLPTEVEKSLSSDMRLLFQCAKCATTGDGSPVALRIHGQLNAARWYTAQSRLLRVYMAQQSPSRELTTLALYIVAVYVPTVMAIKFRPDLVEAPRHLFDELQRQHRHMSGTDLGTVRQRLCGNALMAHPENVAMAMLGDERPEVRARAVQMVREARGRRRPEPVPSVQGPSHSGQRGCT